MQDLGSGVPVTTSKPIHAVGVGDADLEEVALGAPVSVTLNDFDPGSAVTAVIAGDDDDPIA